MSSKSDQSLGLLKPYIRLTKNTSNEYSLWIAVFIPKNYKISQQPSISIENPKLVQVNVDVDGPKKNPSEQWEVVPLVVSLPTPENKVAPDTQIKVTVWLDDPEDEGSTVTKYDEAEEE
ncbi:MAG: hypothetical protein ED557_02230 [Balneola sp.]|nr:MAG: hypothetical protein ED557_02230 [Balneola sp.]